MKGHTMSLLGTIRGLFAPRTCYSSNSPVNGGSLANIGKPIAPIANFDPTDNITLEGCASNTDEENARIPIIQKELNRFLQSKEFADWLCDAKNGLDLEQTEGLTNIEVVEKIQTSKAHLVVQFYYKFWGNVVGYRNPGSNVVYCNRKYHDNYSIAEEASNLAHEACHIIDVTAPLQGFQHDFANTPIRPYSVNYRVNQAFEDLDNDPTS